MKVGPRQAMMAASIAFGGGLSLGAAGIYFHSLPLLYLGYGFLGGTGIGLAYTPPVQTLMQVSIDLGSKYLQLYVSYYLFSGFQIRKVSLQGSPSQGLDPERFCSLLVCNI